MDGLNKAVWLSLFGLMISGCQHQPDKTFWLKIEETLHPVEMPEEAVAEGDTYGDVLRKYGELRLEGQAANDSMEQAIDYKEQLKEM